MGTTANTPVVRGYANASALTVAHLRGLKGQTLAQSDIEKITYSVWELVANGTSQNAVEGHENIEIPVSDVVFDLKTETFLSNGASIEMEFNFEHFLDNSNYQCFPRRGGRYLVRYDIYPTRGFVSPIQFIVRAE